MCVINSLPEFQNGSSTNNSKSIDLLWQEVNRLSKKIEDLERKLDCARREIKVLREGRNL